ncbi:MAG: flavodoxin family protein [Paracoccaceae bacterium]
MDAATREAGAILIVCYSRTGTTRRAAGMLGELCGATLVEVRGTRSYHGPLGLLRAVRYAVTGRAPPVAAPAHDPAAFALTVLAAPVWAGTVASPMRGYVERRAARLGRVAFLCTHHGGGAAGAFRALEAACGHAPVATLSLTARDLRGEPLPEALRRFAHTLTARAGGSISPASWPKPA